MAATLANSLVNLRNRRFRKLFRTFEAFFGRAKIRGRGKMEAMQLAPVRGEERRGETLARKPHAVGEGDRGV